jgi:chromosome partitioning protein
MIIAAYGPKGGAGKTTTAVNVATVLALGGRSVLLVDLEADLNASISLGVRPTDASPSIADVLLHHQRGADAVRRVPAVSGLSLITGSPHLAAMDERLRNVRHPDRRLADVIRPLAAQFDVVVIDAPSAYSRLGLSAAIAADELLVPLRAEYLSLESLAQFLRWYRDRQSERGTLARINGILLTMVDYRRQATREIVDIIRLHNRRGVFATEVPPDPRVAEAPSHGIPLVRYAPRSRASVAYSRLTAEALERANRRRRG